MYTIRDATRIAAAALVATLACTALSVAGEKPQRINGGQREAALEMLKFVRDTLKSRYYDPQLHGVDLDTRYEAAKQRMESAVDTLTGAYGLAAWLIDPLNDRHTAFYPPARPYRIENGFRKEFVGDRCYVTAVEQGSDAAAQGIKPGDQVLGMEGYRMDRDSGWKLDYSFGVLSLRSGLHLAVAPPNAAPRELLVKTQVKKLPKLLLVTGDSWPRDEDEMRMQESRMLELGDKTFVWKLPSFERDSGEVDRAMAKANHHETLILDLRGNGGGLETTLVRLLGRVFDHDVEVARRAGRHEMKPLVANTLGPKKAFPGKLIVLVDSLSGSAAEIFARVVQLEKRGTVIGDRSAGSVMEARVYRASVGDRFSLPFAIQVTESNLIMGDGKSLEHLGVTPDELILPTAEDLAGGCDPVLARAAQLAGVDLSAAKAGTLLPTIWYSQN